MTIIHVSYVTTPQGLVHAEFDSATEFSDFLVLCEDLANQRIPFKVDYIATLVY